MNAAASRQIISLLLMISFLSQALGCSSLQEYKAKGYKVGPNYGRPAVPVEPDWIDFKTVDGPGVSDDLNHWWTVFNDPTLDSLICSAYNQNLTLRQAGLRIQQSRAQLGVAVGNFFPQTQSLTSDFNRTTISTETAQGKFLVPAGIPRAYDQRDYALNVKWELDFWGRFRRAIEAGEATLDQSVHQYDDVLVTLLSDVAKSYVNARVLEQRIAYAKSNIDIQRETLRIAEERLAAGTITELDVLQSGSALDQLESQVPQLELARRQNYNRLCVLLGIPPEQLELQLGPGRIPVAPKQVAIGIPIELVNRRPDVRAAERKLAAQSASIGIAKADYYPHISLNSSLGYSAQKTGDLFKPTAFASQFGPSFTWNILNYGRIRNNVTLQEAKFREFLAGYQNSVLLACQNVEDGLATYQRAQETAQFQIASVTKSQAAVKLGILQYNTGKVDFTRVTQLQATLVNQQDSLAQAQGQIATGLVDVYRALGGGWQIRCSGCVSSNVEGAIPIDVAEPENLNRPTPDTESEASKEARDPDAEGADTDVEDDSKPSHNRELKGLN